jgi:hypothetical protein
MKGIISGNNYFYSICSIMNFPAEEKRMSHMHEEQYVGVWEVIGKILFTCVC